MVSFEKLSVDDTMRLMPEIIRDKQCQKLLNGKIFKKDPLKPYRRDFCNVLDTDFSSRKLAVTTIRGKPALYYRSYTEFSESKKIPLEQLVRLGLLTSKQRDNLITWVWGSVNIDEPCQCEWCESLKGVINIMKKGIDFIKNPPMPIKRLAVLAAVILAVKVFPIWLLVLVPPLYFYSIGKYRTAALLLLTDAVLFLLLLVGAFTLGFSLGSTLLPIIKDIITLIGG